METRQSRLARHLATVKRQAWIVLLAPALALAATFAVLQSRAPVYRASTSLVVGTQAGADLPLRLGTSGDTRAIRNLLESEAIARDVIRRHRLDMSVETFRENLRVQVVPEAALIRVEYDSTAPRLALSVTAEINRILVRRASSTPGAAARGSSGRAGSSGLVLRVFDPPRLQQEPVARSSRSILVFAGLAGLLLGVSLGAAREALDSRIRGRRDAEDGFGAPVLGTLPKGLNRLPPPGVAVGGELEGGTASFDLLRARLQFDGRRDETIGSTVLVTSAGPQTGKAAVAANLAAALARAGERVVCVDADLRRPTLHAYLGTPGDVPGLVEVLESKADLDDALIPVELVPPTTNGAASAQRRGRLEVLPAGNPPARLQLFTLESVDRLLSVLRERADYVVLGGPTLLVSDIFPLAVKSDSVLLVARCGRTTKPQADSARKTLEGLDVENVGVVLTDAAPRDGSA